MPRAYVSHIDDGEVTTGKEFLMLCAGAFGYQTDSKNAQTLVPDEYHKRRIQACKDRIEHYLSMTPEEAAELSESNWQSMRASCKRQIRWAKDAEEKYAPILEEIRRWVPPVDELEELKEFAIKQITTVSGDFANVRVCEEMLAVPNPTPEQWIKAQIEAEEEELSYHIRSWREEVDRTDRRNRWISDLRKSLE